MGKELFKEHVAKYQRPTNMLRGLYIRKEQSKIMN